MGVEPGNEILLDEAVVLVGERQRCKHKGHMPRDAAQRIQQQAYMRRQLRQSDVQALQRSCEDEAHVLVCEQRQMDSFGHWAANKAPSATECSHAPASISTQRGEH